jgi:hypothetical protein
MGLVNLDQELHGRNRLFRPLDHWTTSQRERAEHSMTKRMEDATEPTAMM